MRKQTKQSGFTLIEMLMVIMLVAILAAVAIPQFVDFRTEAKNAAVNSALGALRTGIATQVGQMIIRCQNIAPGTFPTTAAVSANNVTTGLTCAGISTAEQQFVPGTFPENPWSSSTVAANRRAVAECSGAGCARTADCAATAWDGTGATAAQSGWCYNPANGQIWANSGNSSSAVKEYTF